MAPDWMTPRKETNVQLELKKIGTNPETGDAIRELRLMVYSAAIGAGTNSDAETTVTGDLIEWADVVFVMEKSHKNKISKKFNELLKGKRLVCLDIPDNFDCMQPELIKLLKVKVARYIRL